MTPEPRRRFVADAIKNRHLIRVAYSPTLSVELEPHIYGRDGEGREILLGWAIGGRGSGDWTIESIDLARIVEPITRSFAGPRPGYNKKHPQFVTVYACL